MKIRSIVFLTLFTLAPAALAADFGIRAGQYRDGTEEFVGAEIVFDAGVLNVNPNIEYSLADDITSGSANLDLTVDIARLGAVRPYVGAGVGLLYIDDDRGQDETEVLGNLIGGIALDLDLLEPYAQLKYFRAIDDGDTDDFAITIGLRF